MDSREVAAAAVSIILVSLFWLFIIAVRGSPYDVNAYREGYAEGKSGLPERWQESDYSLHQHN